MKTKAVLHMAKKNLCFELEYIQAVIERIEGKVGMQPQNYKLDDDPLMALSESQNTKSAPLNRVGAAEAGQIQRFGAHGPPDKKNIEVSTQKILVYLRQVYDKLDKLKRDYLKQSA